MPLHRGFVLPDAFGNALGNSIVSNRIDAEQTKRNAMLASDALSQQTNGRLNQQLDAEFQQRAGDIANDVGIRLATDGAAGFDANALAQLNATDLMMDQYLNKRADAIDGYLNMSQKTQRDIQSIDARTETGRQQRATQVAQIQQRYDQRTMDFRMANPVYRSSDPLLELSDYHKARIDISTVEAGVSTLHKVVAGYGDIYLSALGKITGSPEIKEVSNLLHNFRTGNGPAETVYYENSPLTKSMMSTDALELNWQKYLEKNHSKLMGGKYAEYTGGVGSWSFNTPSGLDAIFDATFSKDNHFATSLPSYIAGKLDIDPTRHFVGSYTINIYDNGDRSATIEIVNKTSIASYTRDIATGAASKASFSRVQNDYGLKTPYGTITQKFISTRTYPDWVYKNDK
jgi:hypothetical protein